MPRSEISTQHYDDDGWRKGDAGRYFVLAVVEFKGQLSKNDPAFSFLFLYTREGNGSSWELAEEKALKEGGIWWYKYSCKSEKRNKST